MYYNNFLPVLLNLLSSSSVLTGAFEEIFEAEFSPWLQEAADIDGLCVLLFFFFFVCALGVAHELV
jgi:hypothetical protein